MQRATKEGPPTEKVAACWPFPKNNDEMGKKAKTEDARIETEKKTEADTDTEKKKMHIDEFVRKLAEPFEAVRPPWSEAAMEYAADGASPQVTKPNTIKARRSTSSSTRNWTGVPRRSTT